MYKILSIEYAEEISRDSGQSWYQYVISNDLNTVTGLRSGTLAEVKKHAQLFITTLNQKHQQVLKNKRPKKTYKPVNVAQQAYA